MPVANYIYIILFISISLFLIRFIFFKKNKPVSFFAEALKNENSGFFEEAVINYENALNEENKSRFQNSSFKNKITEKLNILHTNIEYNNSFHLTR